MILALALATVTLGVTPAPITQAATGPTPVRCYESAQTYADDSGVKPGWWAGIAGFYGVTVSSNTPIIGLTPNECANLLLVRRGPTVVRAYAAFTLAHELAHARGTAAAYAGAGVDEATVAKIAQQYGLADGQAREEAAADCVGASNFSAMVLALGGRMTDLPQWRSLAKRASGYVPISRLCWR